MYFLATLLVSALSSLHVLAQTPSTLSYDANYGNPNLSLDNVACSTGANGIETKYPQYKTLGSLPSFPNVSAVDTVEGYNSAQCGTCYAVTYAGTGITVNVLAVDRATSGFTTSQATMDSLTDNQSIQFGRVDVTFTQVDPSACGLN